MSKKMLKRSLALSALMAIVITGNAMAAELNIDSEALYNDWKDGGIENWTLDSYKAICYEGLEKDNNKIIFSYDGNYDGLLAVATVSGNDVSGNSVIVDAGSFKATNFEVNGAYLLSGKASNNSVFINGGNFEFGSMAIYGAGNNSSKAVLENNILTINGGSFKSSGAGGTNLAGAATFAQAEGDSAVYNVLNINSVENNEPDFDGDTFVMGGYSHNYDANNNKVNIDAGIFNGKTEIHGGRGRGSAGSNEVTIKNATFNDCVDIYGGSDKNVNDGQTNNNIVTIGEGNQFNSTTNIYGGNRVSTDNVFNIDDGWKGTITSVSNFNTVNFSKGAKVIVTNSMSLGSDATINLADGNDYTGENYAINGKLITLESDNATLSIGNIKTDTYNIAKEYEGTSNWTLENDLMQVAENGWNTNGQLQVTVEAKSVEEIATNLGVSQGTASLVEDIISNAAAAEEAVQFVENVMNSGASAEAKKEAYVAMEKMAEAGGQSATAARIVNNVTGVTNDRLSFNCGHSAPHKGGHGVGLLEEGSGADIWIEYVHGKDQVEDMYSSNGASSYEGQYNGFVMGVDFKKVNKFQSGVAFNYGEGDTNSLGSSARTHSDYDFWGVGYYGNIHNDDSNVIFDINYAKTDSDVTQNSAGGTLEASPETTTLSAGVKVEKLYQNENVQIVPYTGLRFMSIDTNDYATKGGGFMYNMERQNIWLLPVGVSIKQEIVNDNGWTVSPRVDLSYIWAFGDTNSNMEVKSGNGISPIWYDVMDDGSFLGLVGIEAHKGQWGYGVAYSYQKGDHSESKKWFVDVNYSF